MKILLVHTYNMGINAWKEVGMYDREISLYKEYERKHEVIHLTYDEKKPSEKLKAIIKGKKNPLLFSLSNNQEEVKKVDVIKTNQVLGSWLAVRLAKKYDKPLVVRQGYQLSKFEKGWKKVLARLAEKYAYANADAIICTSKIDADYIKEKYHKTAHVILNFIDTNKFKKTRQKNNFKKALFIGRLEEQKNLFSMIEAIKDLDLELTLVGKGSQEKAIKELLKKYQIKHKLIPKIDNNEIPALMNAHDMFLLVSYYEGNPKTLLEAMSCEMPIVCSKVEGIKNLTKDFAFMCNTDAESIKNAIKDLTENKKEAFRRAKNARKFIIKNNSITKYVEREEKILNEIINEHLIKNS